MIPSDSHVIGICDVACRMFPIFRDSVQFPTPLTSALWASERSSKYRCVSWMIASCYRDPLKASPMGFGSQRRAGQLCECI